MVLLVCQKYFIDHFCQDIHYTRLELLQVIFYMQSYSTAIAVQGVLPVLFGLEQFLHNFCLAFVSDHVWNLFIVVEHGACYFVKSLNDVLAWVPSMLLEF